MFWRLYLEYMLDMRHVKFWFHDFRVWESDVNSKSSLFVVEIKIDEICVQG